VFEDLVTLVFRSLRVWRTTSCENGKLDAFRNVRGVVFGEDGIRGGNVNSLKMRSAVHLLVADAVDPNTPDSYADGLLSSWRRFVIVREKVVGDMAEVVHVEVLASGRIDA